MNITAHALLRILGLVEMLVHVLEMQHFSQNWKLLPSNANTKNLKICRSLAYDICFQIYMAEI